MVSPSLLHRTHPSAIRLSSLTRILQMNTQSTKENVTFASPLRIGDVELRNRIAMAAMTRNRAYPETVPNDVIAEYYRQRARSAGLISTEGITTSPQGSVWPYAPGLWSQEQAEAWKKTTEAVHSVGGKIFAQLWHVGRIGHNDMPLQKKAGTPIVSASAIGARGYEGSFKRSGLDPSVGYSIPVAIEDPSTIVAEFKRAAINAKEAGFDGTELHGANGYIFHQFLDNTVNVRTDSWGGSAENRSRLTLEVLKAMAEVFGPGRVGLKVSPAGGYNDVGMTLEDATETFSYVIKEAVAMGLAYVTLVQYGERSDPVINGKKRGTPHSVLATYGHIVRASNGKTKLLLNSGVTPDAAKELISTGQIDAAVLGSAWIGNPDLFTRIEKGLPLNLKPNPVGFYNWKGDDLGDGYTSYPDAE